MAFYVKMINELYGLQCFEYDEYNRYMDEEVNYTEIIQKLCRNRAEWRMTKNTSVLLKNYTCTKMKRAG